ncbi:MAG: hypothetical protein K9I85_11700 [Saprospiraceae bacterium]|nr:hypothetical protein [Saprospiraceae bacterium]
MPKLINYRALKYLLYAFYVVMIIAIGQRLVTAYQNYQKIENLLEIESNYMVLYQTLNQWIEETGLSNKRDILIPPILDEISAHLDSLYNDCNVNPRETFNLIERASQLITIGGYERGPYYSEFFSKELNSLKTLLNSNPYVFLQKEIKKIELNSTEVKLLQSMQISLIFQLISRYFYTQDEIICWPPIASIHFYQNSIFPDSIMLKFEELSATKDMLGLHYKAPENIIFNNIKGVSILAEFPKGVRCIDQINFKPTLRSY